MMDPLEERIRRDSARREYVTNVVVGVAFALVVIVYIAVTAVREYAIWSWVFGSAR